MHGRVGALAVIATLVVGSTGTVHAAPWSGPYPLPTLGTPHNLRIDAAPGVPPQVVWSEGSDVVRATAGPGGVSGRETVGSTETWGNTVAAGAGDRPFVSWAEDGALFLARPGFTTETVAGTFGAGWDGACCPVTPSSPTHGTAAIAFADEWPEGWSVLTEDQSGRRRAFLGDFGPVDEMALAAAGGRVAAAWTETTPTGEPAAVRVAPVATGGTAGPPVVVSTAGRHAMELDAAAGPDGAITVTWVERDPSQAAAGGGIGMTVEITPDGTVGQPVPIPEAPGRVIGPRVVRDAAGRTTFAFMSDPTGHGGGTLRIVERAATGAVAVIDPGVPGISVPAELAGSTDGSAAVVVAGWRGLVSVLRPAGGGWGTAQAVDPACGRRYVTDLTVADGWAHAVVGDPAVVYSAPLDGAGGPPPCAIPGPPVRPSAGLAGSSTFRPTNPPEDRRPTSAAPRLRAVGVLRPGQRTVRVRVTCMKACRARIATTAMRGSTIAEGRVVRRRLRAGRPATITLRLTVDQRSLLRSKRSRLVIEATAPRAGHRSLLRRIQMQPN